jgi:transposase-like protein
MEAVLERYWSSGKTQRVFAEEEGIGVSTLQYWLRQVRDQREQRSGRRKASGRSGRPPAAVALSLLEVDLAGAGNARITSSYEIELPGGTHLRFGAGFAADEVRQLVALLREVR